MSEEKKIWEYDVKCRKCGRTHRMFHSTQDQITKDSFLKWVYDHSTFPIHRQCECDNGMMMLHDLVAYGNILDV